MMRASRPHRGYSGLASPVDLSPIHTAILTSVSGAVVGISTPCWSPPWNQNRDKLR